MEHIPLLSTFIARDNEQSHMLKDILIPDTNDMDIRSIVDSEAATATSNGPADLVRLSATSEEDDGDLEAQEFFNIESEVQCSIAAVSERCVDE